MIPCLNNIFIISFIHFPLLIRTFYNNSLASLPDNAFAGAPNLVDLWVYIPTIPYVSYYCPIILLRIFSLHFSSYLDHNRIKAIHQHTFSGLTNLARLFVSCLQLVFSSLFTYPNHINSHLGHNSITFIGSLVFADIPGPYAEMLVEIMKICTVGTLA